MTKNDIIAIGNRSLQEQFEVGQITEFKTFYICQIVPKGADLFVATGGNCLKINKSDKEVKKVSINEIDMTQYVKRLD